MRRVFSLEVRGAMPEEHTRHRVRRRRRRAAKIAS